MGKHSLLCPGKNGSLVQKSSIISPNNKNVFSFWLVFLPFIFEYSARKIYRFSRFFSFPTSWEFGRFRIFYCRTNQAKALRHKHKRTQTHIHSRVYSIFPDKSPQKTQKIGACGPPLPPLAVGENIKSIHFVGTHWVRSSHPLRSPGTLVHAFGVHNKFLASSCPLFWCGENVVRPEMENEAQGAAWQGPSRSCSVNHSTSRASVSGLLRSLEGKRRLRQLVAALLRKTSVWRLRNARHSTSIRWSSTRSPKTTCRRIRFKPETLAWTGSLVWK